MKKEQGITMVTLVVTIIILIILAGVSINTLIGDNGIIRKTKQARENIIYAGEEEQKQLILNNQDLDKGSMSSLNNTRNLINKLKADGKVTDIQIIKELFGISSKEEIIKLLEDGDEKDG